MSQIHHQSMRSTDTDKTETSSPEGSMRPSWAWILREQIEPLCTAYGLLLEYGEADDESCAIFYGDTIYPLA